MAEADGCSADWGYRADIVYGTDAQKTQAFGNDEQRLGRDSFDNGVYGWAMPQAYAEVAYGDWIVQDRSLLHAGGLRSRAGHRQLLLQPLATRSSTASRSPTPACLGTYKAQRRHDDLRRLDARLGHRLRSVRRRQQLPRRLHSSSSTTT